MPETTAAATTANAADRPLLDHLTGDGPQALRRLEEFLSIPSVSTDPTRQGDIRRAADWLAAQFTELGLTVEVCPTAGHPVVLAHSREGDVLDAAKARSRVLFYGHYDVQPADPVELWTTPPFTPTIRHGAIHARGASDDKGQVACFLEALRAWRKVHGALPGPLTVLIEGEEEIGSVHLGAFIQAHRAQLPADVVLVSDTALWDAPGSAAPKPAITYGMRGLLYFDLQLHGPNRDLHSGIYGGTIANPAIILTQVLSRLFDAHHRVTIPGFYDVQPLGDDERRRWDELGFEEAAYLTHLGMTQAYGEQGYPTLERAWSRPACDFNGLYGGYGGVGAKTIIPSYAGAKVSFRLALGQSAAKVAKAFTTWLESWDVHGCRWRITHLGGCDAVAVSTTSPHLAAAARAITAAAGQAPVFVRDGATIPVISDFKRTLGLDSLLVGFGRTDDRIHSPNEKFDLACFALGCRTHALLLRELAGV
jgi:acetylornithine deacetylase/succinyl-diaminopimelate desuccinylase-like protein